MSTPDSTAVIIFAKEPIAGKAKTRLAASLPAVYGDAGQFAAGLYAVCLEAVFQSLNDLPFPVQPFITPDSSPEYFTRFAAGHIFVQQGLNLGERMHDAFRQNFSRYAKLLLIGSDLPQLRSDTLLAANAALESHDCVLGPAEDGGYYLIGFTKSGFCDCFQGVAWSTDKVLEQTLERLKGKKVTLLEQYRDIDTVEDLAALAASPDCPAAVTAFLSKHGHGWT